MDTTFYDSAAVAARRHELVESFEIPVRSGRAWTVPVGRLCRIVAIADPQVGDLNVWNAHDPRERM